MNYKIEHEKISIINGEGKECAAITFPETSSNVFEINHTFVDDSLRGQGIAGRLVEMAIGEIHRRGGTVTASCSYAQKWIEKHGMRPYVICHMVTSIDGKVTGDFLYSAKGAEVSETYYDINRQLKGDAFACGRVTMESSFTDGFRPDISSFQGADIPYEDYVAETHNYYAVSFDRHGRVGWTESKIHDDDPGYDDCHMIEVLTEDTPKECLAYYRSIGVSYIFAGREEMDLRLALEKLYRLFGIKKLLLEGGSIINGAFQREGLVDELSLVIAPMIADKSSLSLFDGGTMEEYHLQKVTPMQDNSLWVQYRK